MATLKNTAGVFFSAVLPAERGAIQAAELMAAAFAENPKLRGMTIVVTDEDDNVICEVTVPSQQ